MRVFWHNGALQLLPESDREGKLLAELGEQLKFGKPPEMRNSIPGGETTSSSEGLFSGLVCNHELGPSSFAREADDKKHVVSIRKPL